jgi:hypothetical protein
LWVALVGDVILVAASRADLIEEAGRRWDGVDALRFVVHIGDGADTPEIREAYPPVGVDVLRLSD